MKCLNCGEEIVNPQNTMYCSRSCKNKHLTRKNMKEEPKYDRVCKNCGKEFKSKRPNTMYCSVDCNYKVQYQRRQSKVRRKRPQGQTWKESRERVFKLYSGQCWLCSKELPVRWECHHLDHGDHTPDSKRLVPLCSSCHSAMHSITVSPQENGELKFFGRGLDLLRAKGNLISL